MSTDTKEIWLPDAVRDEIQRYDKPVRRSLFASVTQGLDSPDLGNHFAFANGLSANAAYSTDVRRKIRNRFRHERSQNSFLSGMVQSAANYCIGTGPRLQMMTDDKQVNREIEAAFNRHARIIKLAEKLRTCLMSKIEGEGFAGFTANPYVRQQTGISLDFIPLESDQVEYDAFGKNWEDTGGGGIEYDVWGNPTMYPVHQDHPGDRHARSWNREPEWIEREFMCHFYRVDRPGQKRGICEWLSALPLFALYRRMTLAVLGNIENSANMTGVLESQCEEDADQGAVPPFTEEDWFENIPVVSRMLMTLPSGAKLRQWMASQPTAQYEAFCQALLREIARCTEQPFGIAAGDSSDYNYASVRKDDQGWQLKNQVERSNIESEGVNRFFERWLRIHLSQKTGMAPEDHDLSLYPYGWFWDGLEHVDPAKEASAGDTRLRNGTTTRGDEYAKKGQDVDEKDTRAASEWGFEGENAVAEYRAWLRDNIGSSAPTPPPEDEPEEEPPRRRRARSAAAPPNQMRMPVNA